MKQPCQMVAGPISLEVGTAPSLPSIKTNLMEVKKVIVPARSYLKSNHS